MVFLAFLVSFIASFQVKRESPERIFTKGTHNFVFSDSKINDYKIKSDSKNKNFKLIDEVYYDEIYALMDFSGYVDILIQNCTYQSGTEEIKETLLKFVDSNVDIQTFSFDFTQLSKRDLIMYPMIDFSTKIGKEVSSNISISVKGGRFGINEDFPDICGGIIRSMDYSLNIYDTYIEKVDSFEDEETFVLNFDHSDGKKCAISIRDSSFVDFSSVKFIIKSDEEMIFSSCLFEDFADSPLLVNGKNAVTFDNTTFSKSKQNCVAVNTTKWETTENNFISCNFQYVNGIAVVTGKGVNTFTNCNFLNNECSQRTPGALHALGAAQITLDTCNFTDNVGTYHGGAVLINIESFNIFNCIFDHNSCIKKDIDDESEKAQGGAIFIYQHTKFNLMNCTFRNNFASTNGGALFIQYRKVNPGDQANQDLVHIQECTFEQCYTDGDGGALTSGIGDATGTKCDGDILVDNCTFINCNATNFGGALMFLDGTVKGDEFKTIKECIFDKCSCTNGACIYSLSYKFSLEESTFKNIQKYNPKSSFESIIYLKMNEKVDPIIYNCTFSNNEVESVSCEVDGTLTMRNCTFTGTTTKDSLLTPSSMISKGTIGGNLFDGCIFENTNNCGVKIEKQNHTFTGCIFRNIKTEKSSHKALYAKEQSYDVGYISVNDCLFTDNSGISQGGAAFINTQSIISFDGNRFINNKVIKGSGFLVRSQGGSLCIKQVNIPIIFTISNCYFEESSSEETAGAIFCEFQDIRSPGEVMYNIPINIDNCQFVKCSSVEYGGAITNGTPNEYGSSSGDLTTGDIVINECEFEGCTSKYGGCICCHDGTENGDEETNITNCIFKECSATKSGSCIYSLSYRNVITNCVFDSIKSEPNIQSQIIYILMNEDKVSPIIQNCNFINNVNQQFYLSCKSDLIFDNCTFKDNSNTNNGGSISIESNIQSKSLEFNKCTFTNCKSSSGNGGAISYSPSQCNKITVKECIFTKLSSKNGGAIWISQSNTLFSSLLEDNNDFDLTITSSKFTDCQATENGGAIYCDLETKVSIVSCNFFETKCGQKGATIYSILNGKLNLLDIGINIEKKDVKETAVYVTQGKSTGLLQFDGGCFISNERESNDKTPDFLYFDSVGDIQFSDYSCFTGNKDSSIFINKELDLNSDIFNCNRCSLETILPSRSPAPGDQPSTDPTPINPSSSSSSDSSTDPTPINPSSSSSSDSSTDPTPINPSSSSSSDSSTDPTPINPSSSSSSSSSDSSTAPTTSSSSTTEASIDETYTTYSSSDREPDGSKSKGKKSNVGLIAGITIGIIVVIIIIILIILLVLKRKSTVDTKNTNDQVSEEVDNDIISQFMPSNNSEDEQMQINPLYSQDKENSFYMDNNDPFLKDFEESI